MSDKPIVFGQSFFCKRCGALAERKGKVNAKMGAAQADAYSVEYCENCQPTSFWQALALAAGLDRVEAQP